MHSSLSNSPDLLRWLEAPTDIHMSGGGAVAALEDKMSKYYGKKYALCVCNATTGLWAVLRAKNMKGKTIAGSEITWPGAYSGALQLSNRINLVKSTGYGFNLNPTHLRELALQQKIDCVITCDFGGYPHDTQAIRSVCDKFGIFYLADASQSLGATYNGFPASNLADAIVVSLGSNKTISVGEGAMIITDDASLFEILVQQTQHPIRQSKDTDFSSIDSFAFNLRIHPISAVIANEYFEKSIKKVQSNAIEITSMLKSLADRGVIAFLATSGISSTWFQIYAKSGTGKLSVKEVKALLPAAWTVSEAILPFVQLAPGFDKHSPQFSWSEANPKNHLKFCRL